MAEPVAFSLVSDIIALPPAISFYFHSTEWLFTCLTLFTPPLPAPRVAAALKKIDRFLPFALESIAEELLLCGIYVAGGDCSAADFGRLDMRESRLEGVVLQGCGFEGSSFIDVQFDRCDFSGARFAGAYFERAPFHPAR